MTGPRALVDLRAFRHHHLGFVFQKANLDGHLGRQVMDLFRRVAHEQRAGVIVVTHDHRSLDVFDRVLEMEDGHLRAHVAASRAA